MDVSCWHLKALDRIQSLNSPNFQKQPPQLHNPHFTSTLLTLQASFPVVQSLPETRRQNKTECQAQKQRNRQMMLLVWFKNKTTWKKIQYSARRNCTLSHSKGRMKREKPCPVMQCAQRKFPHSKAREAAPWPIKQRTEGASVRHILEQWGQVDGGAQAMPPAWCQSYFTQWASQGSTALWPSSPGKAFQSRPLPYLHS